MNSVNLIGNLTRDPEIRNYGDDQKAVCYFTIAINRLGDGADFPRIVTFGKTAENCSRYLSKGRKVGITGRISTSGFEKDGQKQYRTEVIADRVEFLSGVQMDKKDDQEPEQVQAQFAAIAEDIPF